MHLQKGHGHIIFKMNALVDPAIITLLYRASQVGVKVDLIVRGISCLRPGVPHISENIRVISIVGRFLEHSRAYWFRNGDDGHDELYLGSADIMQRNLDRRVEIVFPVLDADIRKFILEHVLHLGLRDTTKARVLTVDGRYVPAQAMDGQPSVDSQLALLRG